MRLHPPVPAALRTLMLALLLGGWFAPRVQAESLRREWLPADAFWVGHLDIESVGKSVLGRSASVWSKEQPALAAHMKRFKEQFQLHPLWDLRGLTFYGSSAAPDHAVMIAVASRRMDGLLAKLRSQPEHVLNRVHGLDIHTWTAGQLPMAGPSFAWFGEMEENDRRVLVVADRVELLTAAVALVRSSADGPRALSTDEDALLEANPAPGTTLYFEVGRGLPLLLGRLPDSRLARQARRVQVMLGELDGRAQAFMRIETGNPANSRDVADVLRGGVRLLRLALESGGIAPELAKRVDDLRVQEKRAEVFVHFRGPAVALAAELGAALARWPSPAEAARVSPDATNALVRKP